LFDGEGWQVEVQIIVYGYNVLIEKFKDYLIGVDKAEYNFKAGNEDKGIYYYGNDIND